jgi:ACR3 family arsenite efflux pump ArsB
MVVNVRSARRSPEERRPSDAVLGGLSVLDRFLPVWIVAAMVCGIILGRLIPDLALRGDAISRHPGGVARIALPLLTYFGLMWVGSFARQAG